MAKRGKAIVWVETTADEWEQLSPEQRAAFIEMATPDEETIELAKSTVTRQLRPFLEAGIKEEILG